MNSIYKLLIQIMGKETASPQLRKVGRELEGVEQKASAMSKTLQTVAGIAFSYVAKQAVQAVWDFGELGAESLRLKAAFQDLAGAASDDLLRAIQEAAGGTVSELDAMAAANRGILLGMGADIEQWSQLVEVARFRARAMGIDVTQAVNDIATGIGRESRLILDNLGIIIDTEQVMEDYADSVGKAADALSAAERKQAIMTAVIADGQRMIAQAGGVTDDYKDSIERMNAAFEDMKVTLAEGVAPAVADVASAIADSTPEIINTANQLVTMAEAGMAWIEAALSGEDATAAFNNAILAGVGAMDQYASNTYEARREALLLRPAVEDLEKAFNDLAVGVWAGTYAQLQAIEVYEYRREGIVRKTEDDVARLKQINESFLDDLHRKTKTTLDSVENSYDDLRSKVESALQPTQVTALDMGLTDIGKYTEKWDENARRLAAIGERGFAELERHADWAAILKIPPDVMAAGEEALKSWAQQTAADVRNLMRPDLLVDHLDAAVAAVQDYLNREAAKELSLDIITKAVIEQGVISGEDAKKKVAAALGLDQTFIGEQAGEQFKSGLMQSLGDTNLSMEFASYMQKDIGEGSGNLRNSGQQLWGAVEVGILFAMQTTDYAQEFARLVAPHVAKILQDWDNRTGG